MMSDENQGASLKDENKNELPEINMSNDDDGTYN